MPDRKNIYLPDDVLKWLEKERGREERGLSNFITKLCREEMKRRERKRK